MSSKPAPILLIVDGNAIVHRAFHAIPPLQTRDGRVVNAVYGFLSILIKTLKDLRPAYVVVAFDRKGKTFRHEAYEAYKGKREKQPDDLYAQIPMVEELLGVLNIPALGIEGFEADDLIATFCEKTKKEKNLDRVILTGDQDTMQLVDAHTRVLTPGRGIKETLLYDEAKVRERYGLEPAQMIDYKALRGDPSDNIPGVRGIGEKGATALLSEFGTLEKLYKELEADSAKSKKIPAGQRKALTEHKKDALQAKELVTLVHDAPVEFNLVEAKLKQPDHEKLLQALSDLDFKSLMPRIEEAFGGNVIPTPSSSLRGAGATKQTHGKKTMQVISTDAHITSLAKALKEQEKVALRTFCDGHFLDGKLTGLSFAWDDANYVVSPKKEYLAKLKTALESDEIKKICHNAKADIEILRVLDIELRGVVLDVMLASYILNPGTRAHELDALVFSELGRELPTMQKQQALTLPSPKLGEGGATSLPVGEGDREGFDRFAAEATAVWELATKLAPRLKEENLTHILEKFELPLAPVLAQMERDGVSLDTKFLAALSTKLNKRIDTLEKKIKDIAGTEVNVNSAAQLAEVLFEKLKIQEKVRIRKTAGGTRLSTAAGELEKMKDAHPIVPLILEYRELAKLTSTYVDALPKLVRADTHRIHTTYNQTVAATGRLSSSDPNLQNIPVRSELGREIRKAFVAAPGHELIVADYSQFELRILAHLSEDPAMIDAFKSGQDIHSRTASEVWGVPIDTVTKEQRYAAKAINFGIAYGMGANALAESAGIPREEARAFIDKYFLTFPKVREYIDNTKELAHAQGYAETVFGRRRYLPELRSNIPYLRAAGERMAVNAPIQGTNADAIKLAMIELHHWIGERYGFGADAQVRMLLQVHDELVFETKKGLAEEVIGVIKEKMEHAVMLRVPVVIDVRIGSSWGELENAAEEHEEAES
jgi:DNA polymerase-1